MVQTLWNEYSEVEYDLTAEFTSITIVGDVITFGGGNGISDVTGEVEYDNDGHVFLETLGLTNPPSHE